MYKVCESDRVLIVKYCTLLSFCLSELTELPSGSISFVNKLVYNYCFISVCNKFHFNFDVRGMETTVKLEAVQPLA